MPLDSFYDFSNNTQPITWPQRSANQTNFTDTESDQWLRKVTLFVYGVSGGDGDKGDAIVFTPNSSDNSNQPDVRITFQVKKETTESPNLLFARVYNLAPATKKKVLEFRRVSLSAGYRTGKFGEIFRGTVAQFRLGKETAVDTYLEIIAGDADTSINTDVISLQWDKGTSLTKIVEDHVGQMKGFNQSISKGQIDVPDRQLLKSMSAHGMIRDSMRMLTNSFNGHWWVDSGKVHVIKQASTLQQGEVPELTPSTGLIGMPELTQQGIQIQCLLNPNLVLGGKVKVRTDLLSGVPYTPGSQTKLNDQGQVVPQSFTGGFASDQSRIAVREAIPLDMPFTSPVGEYKILFLDHNGDNRGNPWYSQMICVALDQNGAVMAAPAGILDRSVAPGLGQVSTTGGGLGGGTGGGEEG